MVLKIVSKHSHARTRSLDRAANAPSVPKLCPGAKSERDCVLRLLVQAFPPQLLCDLLEPLLLLRQHLRGQDDLAGDVFVFIFRFENNLTNMRENNKGEMDER